MCTRQAPLEAIEKSHEESMFLQVPKKGETGHGSGASRADTVFGLADHDNYHLGQIALLRKSLKSQG